MSSDNEYTYNNYRCFSSCSIKKNKIKNSKKAPEIPVQLIEKLNIMCMMSNPIIYKRRIELAKKFISRMNLRNDIELFIVEIVYTDRGDFQITEAGNYHHLQIKAEIPLWHKENAINVGIKKLLPDNWKSVCWIDMDIIFENDHWVSDALTVLNTSEPVFVQLFSHAIDMDRNENTMSIFQGFAYQYSLGKTHDVRNKGNEYWHPGYCWAINRAAYNITGGLYELSIIGSGDYNMALSLINKGSMSLDSRMSDEYKKSISLYQEKMDKKILLKHVPGVIRHEFHGSKANRKYVERNVILFKNCFDPYKHLTYRVDGLLIPSEECPQKILDEIIDYFTCRNEDDGTISLI